MHYNDCKKMTVNLEDFGGNRSFSIEELVSEIVRNRRDRFYKHLFDLKVDALISNYCFDAIAFKAATSDFEKYFSFDDENFEGYFVYQVTAGESWTWTLKTNISWGSVLPLAGGCFKYHTDIIETQNVGSRINAMTGTAMKIKIIEKNLHHVSWEEALQRDKKTMKMR